MTIATDLKEVLQDVGTEIRVIKPDGKVFKGEHIDLESSTAVNSFVRAFYLEGTLTADSVAVAGDIIEMVVTGHKYLVATKVPEIFENAVTSFNATLYRCNVTLDILRLAAGSAWDANYQLVNGWQPVKTGIPALLTDDAGTEIDADRDVGKLGIFDNVLYISAFTGIKTADRVFVSEDEYYMVREIRKRKYEDVWVCTLSEDTRK